MMTSTRALALTDDALRRVAPSVFADRPAPGLSNRYGFVPTIAAVDTLRESGFLPVKVEQSSSRTEGGHQFARHLIRFRTASDIAALVPDREFGEIVLSNSHDGSSGYQLSAGIFRVICANGMICESADMGAIRVRHTGNREFRMRIIDATKSIGDYTPRAMGRIERWRQMELTPPDRGMLVDMATTVRPVGAAIKPDAILMPRRPDDRSGDLWTTFNVVQESLVRGGLSGESATGRKVQTRPIASVDESIRVNRGLWSVAERMADYLDGPDNPDFC